MILRDIKSKMILTMLLIVLSAQGVWAETVEIPISSLSKLDGTNKHWFDTTKEEDATWHIYTIGTCSFSEENGLTVNDHTQFIILSDKKIFSKVEFLGGVTGEFNKCHNFVPADGPDYSIWNVGEGFTNENYMSITPKNGNVVLKNGNIRITYSEPAGALKTTPIITLNFYDENANGQEVQPNGKYITPAVRINANVGEGGQMVDVSNDFILNYFIDGKSPVDVEFDKDKKEITKDDATGTTIQRLYGGIEVGSKAGTVTFNVAVLPKDDSKYNMSNEKFNFVIIPHQPELTVNPSDIMTLSLFKNQYNDLAKSQELKYPSYKITDKVSGEDITNKYNVEFSLTDPNNILTDVYDGSGESAKKIGFAYNTEGKKITDITLPDGGDQTASLTVTATPKVDDPTYAFASGENSKNIVIKVIKPESTLGVTMSLDNWEFNPDEGEDAYTINVYKYSDKFGSKYNEEPLSTPIPELTDQYGNPVDERVEYVYIMKSDVAEKDYCGEDSINHTNNEAHGVWKRSLTEEETTQGIPQYGVFSTYWAGVQKVAVRVHQYNQGKYTLKSETVNTADGGTGTYNFVCGTDGEPLEKEFYIHVHKRTPQLVLTPNPRYMNIGKGIAWNPGKRIDVAGYFYDKYTHEEDSLTYSSDKNGDTFWYALEFTPESGIQVTSWPAALQGRVLIVYNDKTYEEATIDESGNISNVNSSKTVQCYRYYSAKGFGNENFQVVFTKSTADVKAEAYTAAYKAAIDDNKSEEEAIEAGNKAKENAQVKFRYLVLPWNHSRWDVGEEEITVTVSDKTPVDMAIEPNSLIKTTCDFDEVDIENAIGWQTANKINGANIQPTVVFKNSVTQATTYDDKNLSDCYDLSFSIQSRLANGEVIPDEDGKPGFSSELFNGDKNNIIVELSEGSYLIGNGWWQTYAKFDPTNCDLYFNKSYLPTSVADALAVVIHVKATPKEGYESVLSATETDYTVYLTYCTNNGKPLYEIINETSNDADDAHNTHKVDFNNEGGDKTSEELYAERQEGKLHFINEGKIYGGTIVKGMPGMDVVLGNFNDIVTDAWQIQKVETSTRSLQDYTNTGVEPYTTFDNAHKEETANTHYVFGSPVELDENSFPVGGTFYTLRPWTNGFLYVDALWDVDKESKKPVSYMLINRNKKGEIETDLVTAGSEKSYNEKRFRFALLAGTTYYLYAIGGDGIMKLHGLSYQPAFLLARADNEAYNSATAFLAGIGETTYTESVPNLLYSSNTNVTFSSETPAKVEVNSANGKLDIKGTSTDNNDRIRITGVVKSGDTTKYPNVHKAPWYRLFISDIPTYVTQNGYKPAINERISTTNHRTAIEMTYGGWDSNGPYYAEKINYVTIDGVKTASGTTITTYDDSWKVAKMDSVGKDNRTLDGFKYGSQGGQNGKDEKMNENSGNYPGGATADTYDVPCRGTYLRFEPHENGRLAVYLMQSGICDYSVANPDWTSKIKSLTYRPLYLVDETGKPIKLAVEAVSNAQGKEFKGHESECLLRSPLNPIVDGVKQDFDFSKLDGKFVVLRNNEGEITSDLTSTYDLATYLKDQWKDLKTENEANPSIIQAYETSDGGYITLTKAYMRYSFDVKAGKSYYIFSNSTKLFFDGFAFIPDGWTSAAATTHGNEIETRAEATENTKSGISIDGTKKLLYGAQKATETLTNSDNNAPSAAKGFNTPSKAPATVSGSEITFVEKTNVDVTLERGFTAGSWTSICVPFSVSETQFKEVFGPSALIVGFDGLNEEREAMFTQHVYHMIEAGRPYFIKPAKNYNSNDGYAVFKNVTIEANIPAKTIDCGDYEFVGSYSPLTLTEGDYVFIGQNLWRVKSSYALQSYRAYLKLKNTGDIAGSRIMGFAFNDIDERTNEINYESETTGIDDIYSDVIVNDGSMTSDNVYNMQGQVVRSVSTSIEGLPKGVYIVNGKKYIVK